MENLKPYPAYRDSGVAWLGAVPEHWELLPGRACFREKKRPNLALQEKTVLSLSYGQVVVKPLEKLHGLVPSSFETYQIINPLDIVIRPTDLQNDWNSLRFGFSRHRGIITSAYLCFCTINIVTPEYGYFLLHSYDLMKVFYGLGSGLRQNLDWSDFKYLPCSIPPPSEQTTIVRFLEHAERQIQRHIHTKEKLIALLEEQKKGIIHEAVTGRIDVRTGKPYSAYKDSGVDWLGAVPEHWEVVQIGRIGKFLKGVGGTKEDEVVVGLPCIRYGDIYTSHKYHIEHTRSCISRECSRDYMPLQYGDILFAGSGETIEEIGKSVVNLLTSEAYCGGDVIILRLSIDTNARFMGYAAESAQSAYQKSCMGRGITVMHIYSSQLKYMSLMLPPLPEQTAIAAFLDQQIADIDAAIARARHQIDLLREYRTRLIADVVTGKLDVREAAVGLLDETTPLV